ncbi:transposase [Brevibacillus sp. IT-7CA2]
MFIYFYRKKAFNYERNSNILEVLAFLSKSCTFFVFQKKEYIDMVMEII